MIAEVSLFLDGLCAYFAQGTALGALVTFLLANLPTLAVTVSTVKKWLSGAKHSIAAVEKDCRELSARYAADIASLQAAVEGQKNVANQTLAVLALAFGNSKLEPAVRAEIEKVITGAIDMNRQTELSKLLADVASVPKATPEPLPEDLAEFATSTVLLQA